MIVGHRAIDSPGRRDSKATRAGIGAGRGDARGDRRGGEATRAGIAVSWLTDLGVRNFGRRVSGTRCPLSQEFHMYLASLCQLLVIGALAHRVFAR